MRVAAAVSCSNAAFVHLRVPQTSTDSIGKRLLAALFSLSSEEGIASELNLCENQSWALPMAEQGSSRSRPSSEAESAHPLSLLGHLTSSGLVKS